MPHIIASTGIHICRGFALATGSGAKVSVMLGLITLLIAGTPVWIVGSGDIMISGLMVSALGIRLNALSIENGHSKRTATIPQSST